MARQTGYTYWHTPARASMRLVEGSWSDDDDYKLGGYFSAPLDKDMWVALYTGSDFTVMKATASTNTVIGKLISEPQGEHNTTSGRYGTVLLLGDFVLEVECATNSAINIGAPVKLTASGGTYAEGVWTSHSAANGTIALAAYATASGAGYKIPVLFNWRAPE